MTDRVNELEATIEQNRDQEEEHPHEAHAVDDDANDDESVTVSVWGRTKRLFEDGSE